MTEVHLNGQDAYSTYNQDNKIKKIQRADEFKVPVYTHSQMERPEKFGSNVGREAVASAVKPVFEQGGAIILNNLKVEVASSLGFGNSNINKENNYNNNYNNVNKYNNDNNNSNNNSNDNNSNDNNNNNNNNDNNSNDNNDNSNNNNNNNSNNNNSNDNNNNNSNDDNNSNDSYFTIIGGGTSTKITLPINHSLSHK